MFESLKGMAGLAGLMKDLPRIKRRMEEARQRLGACLVTGEAGGGAVRVHADGAMRVHRIEIDRALLAGLVEGNGERDHQAAEQLLADAVNEALRQSRRTAELEIAAAAEELDIPIPAGALSGWLT